ncbi:MAG: hypothetical protein H8E15_08225 [Planctomycetes bacterium]|nr:hypothetical protein [Planctomycetota bacterium]
MNLLCIAILHFALAQQSASSPVADAQQPPVAPPAMCEVIVLGMIHGGHRNSELWGLDEVRETIRRIQPDVVLCEIPPNLWPAASKLWREKKVIEDARIKRFPEYTDVVLPLMDELKFELEPCAAWTSAMASARGKVIAEFEKAGKEGEVGQTDWSAYRQAEAWVAKWAAPHALADADPMVIHSPQYDHVTKGTLLPYDHWLNSRIGVGGWTQINEAHYALIDQAIKRHPGKRILITFGAGHKYWFLEQLRWRSDVKLLDARSFLPGSEQALTEVQRVKDEVFKFAECTWRCFYDEGNAYMHPAMNRISNSMSPRDSMLVINGLRRGPQGSTFLDRQWLSPVTVAPIKEGEWKVSFTISRALQAPNEAGKASAILIADQSRPGGFRWTEINWPR